MEKKTALGYIAYFVENNSVLSNQTTKQEMRKYLAGKLGKKMFESSDEKLASLARRMYIAHVLSLYTRYSSIHILKKDLTDSQMKDLLKEQVSLDKKYDLYFDVVDRDLKESTVDKMISKRALTSYKTILNKMIPELSPTAVKEAARKEREAKKAARESGKKPTSSKKPVTSTKKPTSTGKSGSKSKSCSELTVVELKEKAKAKGLSGYSKLKKDELCKLLKIK